MHSSSAPTAVLASRFKAAVTANAAIMLLKVGSIVVILLKLFSDMQLPAGSDTARLRGEAAFAIISCFTTVFCFAANVMGMKRVLQAARAASEHVRQRLSWPASARSSVVSPVDGPQAGQCTVATPDGIRVEITTPMA